MVTIGLKTNDVNAPAPCPTYTARTIISRFDYLGYGMYPRGWMWTR